MQGHAPGQAKAHSPVYEQDWVRRELELIREADRHNWKYVWVTEHHFLEEYSHLSDSVTFMAYALAQTERIHIGSGIFNMNPTVNHPVRLAERVAMLDQLSQGRFEFGTGRGAGSHEIGGFGLTNDETRSNWEETIREIPKMWKQKGYSYPDGSAFKVPATGTQSMPNREGAFNVLPKPYAHTHPALWVAAGNPGTYERAAKKGLGLLGFNIGSVWEMATMIKMYKDNIGQAEPVGDYVNDNVMITTGFSCLADRQRARENACNMGYARGECDRFAGESGPDAVRFVLRNDDGRAVRIDYTMERAHLPWAHGSVTFHRAGRKWSGLDAGTVSRAQAEAYLRSYLEWKESESAAEE